MQGTYFNYDIWELIKNAKSQALPRPTEPESSLSQDPQVICMYLKM